MRSMRRRLVRHCTLAVSGISLIPLVMAMPARAAVPPYTCPPPTVYPVGGGNVHPGNLTVADFNSDHAPDVAVAILGGGISVFLNTGTGQLGTPSTYPATDIEGSEWVVPADLNGDGNVDLATSSSHSNSISVFFNNGDGTFAKAVRVRVGFTSGGLAAADFNDDGSVDLVSVGGDTDGLLLLLNNGDGTFKRPRPVPTGSSATTIVVGDFNHDGSPDLATSNINNDNSVTVLLNAGNGKFPSPRIYRVGDGPFGIATGDLNNDGYLDLVTANLNNNTFSVLFNRADGTGTFRMAQSFTGAGGQVGVVVADVNGDGLPDIVGANPFGDNIMVLLNKGGHTFLPPVSCQAAPGRQGPYHLAAADFNGDGRIDIVTQNREDTMSVLLSGG